MSFEYVAKRLRAPSNVVAKWESGEERPTYSQLEKLAYGIYKRPLAVFFFPEPPEEEGVAHQFRSLPPEEVERLSVRIRLLTRRATVFLEGLRELFDNVNPAPQKIFQDIKIVVSSDMRKVASKVRKYLGVSEEAQFALRDNKEALDMWRQVVENAGVSVFKDAFKDNDYSGFCLHDDEFPIIYLNNSMPKNRQIFTIFHEMAHILMKKGGVDFRSPTLVGDRTEVACNRFAAELLLPHDIFLAEIAGVRVPTVKAVEGLARRYKVSRETIWRKFLTEERIDQSRYDEAVRAIREGASSKKEKRGGGGDSHWNTLSYLSPKYTDRAMERYHQNRLSAMELSEYLAVNPYTLDDLIGHYLQKGAH